MEKKGAERQLELQDELASLQVNNENLTTELNKREQQLAEVTSRPVSIKLPLLYS